MALTIMALDGGGIIVDTDQTVKRMKAIFSSANIRQ